MEHLSGTLVSRLSTEIKKGDVSADLAITQIDKEMNVVVSFMKGHGFLHFDAHFQNLLTDDKHVYFADFGLAICLEFKLSQEEKAFFDKHKNYDRYVVIANLVWSSISEATSWDVCRDLLNEWHATGKVSTSQLPPSVQAIVKRYLPIVLKMDLFLTGLGKDKNTPYPFP
jgi:predicted unusual protein kinase regulating ubiquinone biosynthesis (AarF/ABC1/UbiB family)